MLSNNLIYAPEVNVPSLIGFGLKPLMDGAKLFNMHTPIHSLPRISGIYKITSPSGKIYIGQSVHLKWREYLYSRTSCKHQPRLFNSIKKYGWGKHKFEMIHQCCLGELNDLEVYYISFYNTFATAHGLNLREGGKQNAVMAEESKKKVGDGNRGKIRTPEARKRMSIGQRESTTRKRKQVYQFNENGIILNSFKCSRSASEETGINESGIRDCCKKYHEWSHGYYWSYDPFFSPTTIKTNCKWCQKEITKHTHNKLFCSHDCWEKNYKIERSDFLKERAIIKEQKRRAKNLLLKQNKEL